ncbi:hypothetical protein ACM66B_003447 [Microbotryomycetes sp. NB124-2]
MNEFVFAATWAMDPIRCPNKVPFHYGRFLHRIAAKQNKNANPAGTWDAAQTFLEKIQVFEATRLVVKSDVSTGLWRSVAGSAEQLCFSHTSCNLSKNISQGNPFPLNWTYSPQCHFDVPQLILDVESDVAKLSGDHPPSASDGYVPELTRRQQRRSGMTPAMLQSRIM